jgi:hypothetical protein
MNSIKIVRKNGKFKHILYVIDIEYEKKSEVTEIKIKIATASDFSDYIIEEITLMSGDRAFLMNGGRTIDIIDAPRSKGR